MLVREIMTVAPACCSLDTRLDIVAKMMLNHDCEAVLVCDGDRLTGMVTERDIVRRAVARELAGIVSETDLPLAA